MNVKNINPGELRTPIRIECTVSEKNSNGFQEKTHKNIFGENEFIRCKWVNAHGTEIYSASTLNLREPATVTIRYSPLVNANCVIFKRNDKKPFEIISVDNIREMNKWLELKVQRMK